MFTTLIVQPIFNLLVFILAILPGHDLGVAIIIFTIIVRFLMLPLIKKQLRHAKAMRELQPEIKKIKKAAAGDRQRESVMVMELYKEREINPFASIGVLLIQLPILIGLYSALRKLILDPSQISSFAYPFIQGLSWVKEIAANPASFNPVFLGIVDLSKAALYNGVIYWPAMAIVVGSAISQYFQSKQLMPTQKDARSLRQILKDASSGKQAEQGEVNAAVGQTTKYFVPIMILLFTLGIASALSLYWMTSGIVAYIQQSRILKKDEEELEKIADSDDKKSKNKEIIEGEIIETKTPKKSKSSKKKSKKRKKRNK